MQPERDSRGLARLRRVAFRPGPHRGRARERRRHSREGGGLADETAGEQIEIAARLRLNIALIDRAEKIGEAPAAEQDRHHRRDRPDELPAQIGGEAPRRELERQLMLAYRPHRKSDDAGEQAAQQLDRNARRLHETAAVEHVRRPERGRRDDESGAKCVEREGGGGEIGVTARGGGERPRAAGENERRAERRGKADDVARDRRCAGEAGAGRDHGDDERQRNMNPSARLAGAERSRLHSREFEQKEIGAGHQRLARQRESDAVADDEREQIEPFDRAMRIAEEGERDPARAARALSGCGEADRAEQKKRQAIEKENEIELRV